MRNGASGFLAVSLALYLAALGLGSAAIGVVFAAALAGGAIMTILLTSVSNRLGRRAVLRISAMLMGLAGAVIALTGNVVILAAAALLGSVSPSGKEIGPFLAVEQAILPQSAPDRARTGVFARYNLIGSFSSALGALAAGLPARFGLPIIASTRVLLWADVLIACLLLVIYAGLSPAVEAPAPVHVARRGALGPSRAIVARLAALFAVDSFAGAFVVQGLVAYWFHARFGVDIAALGGIFFGVNLCAALSFLAAAPLARRIGLLNTMVFTHLPSNVLLMLVPLMPNAGLAVATLLLRSLCSQMDVPTRQSYTMAVVTPEERATAAGVTSVARNAAAAAAPAFAGATLAFPALGLPFLIAGALKIGYDLAVLATFRGVKPPEERKGRAVEGVPPGE